MGETEAGSTWASRFRALKSAVTDPAIGRPILALGWFAAAEFGTYVATGLYAFALGGTPYVAVMFVTQLVASAVLVPFVSRLAADVPRASALLASYVAQAVAWLSVGIVIYIERAPFLEAISTDPAVRSGLEEPAHRRRLDTESRE